jgi:hypothetical protein
MLFEGDTDPTPPQGMVTVGKFESPVEAQMAKGMLESAGVECMLTGENVNSLMPAAFGVRLLVAAEDEAAALELMAQPADDGLAEDSGE